MDTTLTSLLGEIKIIYLIVPTGTVTVIGSTGTDIQNSIFGKKRKAYRFRNSANAIKNTVPVYRNIFIA